MAHADLVDGAHVEHLDTHVVHKLAFTLVHTADTNLADVARLQRGHLAADVGQRVRPVPTQAGHRHAVDVAAGGHGGGVEVGMGVEPQHP